VGNGKDIAANDPSSLDILEIIKDIGGDDDNKPTVFAETGYLPNPNRLGVLKALSNMTGSKSRRPQGELPPPPSGSGVQMAEPWTYGLQRMPYEWMGEAADYRDEEEGRDFIAGHQPLLDILKDQSNMTVSKNRSHRAQGKLPPPPSRHGTQWHSEAVDYRDFAKPIDMDSAQKNEPFYQKNGRHAGEAQRTGDAAQKNEFTINVGAVEEIRKRLGLSGKTEPIEVGTVDTIQEFHETYGKLLPDQSKTRQKITQDYEKALQAETDRDVVPQGLKDIRSEYENRIKALDKSGLPFMTAAAAVLKGNQPTLVALTNAMIGYTAGDEQLKKQGLSMIKDMSKIDVDIATLEAAQRQEVSKARSNVLKAREAELKGQESRAESSLEVAAKAQTSAQNLAIKKAELQDRSEQRKNQIFATIAPTIITNERKERMFREATQAFIGRGLSEGEAKIKALTLLEGRGSSLFAEQNQMLKLEAAELRRDNQITKFFKDAASSASRNFEIRDAAKKDGLQLTGDDLMLYGVQKGLVPITNALRNTPAGQSIIEQAKQKFGPQAQGGKESKGSATWEKM